MLTVIFAPWSRPACQPDLSRHRLERFFRGTVSPRSKVTGDLASAPCLPRVTITSTGGRFLTSAGSLLQTSQQVLPLQQCWRFSFSPRLLQKLWNCSYHLGSCPFLLGFQLWPAYHPRLRPTSRPPPPHAPQPLTAARGTQIPVLAGCLHSCWSWSSLHSSKLPWRTSLAAQCLGLYAYPCQGLGSVLVEG